MNWPQAETPLWVIQSESNAPQECVRAVAGVQETRLLPAQVGSARLEPPSKRPAHRSVSTRHNPAAAQLAAEARQPVSAHEKTLVRTARAPGNSGITAAD